MNSILSKEVVRWTEEYDFFLEPARVSVKGREVLMEVPEDAMFLGSLDSKSVKCLNDPGFFNTVVEVVDTHVMGEDTFDGEKFKSRLDMLLYAYKQPNVGGEFRRNLRLYGVPRTTNCGLSFNRYLRGLFPSRNKASKTFYTRGSGATYTKFDFGLEDKTSIFFGNAHPGHLGDCMLPKNIVNIDTDACGLDGYLEGNVKDWRVFVDKYRPEVIYSDVAVGGDGNEGFGWTRALQNVYQEMIDQSNCICVIKVHLIARLSGNVISKIKIRPHNDEIIVQFEGSGPPLDLSAYIEFQKEVNADRTAMVLGNYVPLSYFPFVWKDIGVKAGCFVKCKKRSRFKDVCQFIKSDKRFINRCMDAEEGGFIDPSGLGKIDFPLIFMDYRWPAGLKEGSVFDMLYSAVVKQKRTPEFDKDLGWIAL